MDNPGIIKEIDKLGRLVIPKEIRERYGLDEYVEITTTRNGVLIRNPRYKLICVDEKTTMTAD